MNGFKLCSNGHYYEDSVTECPYCPKTDLNKTQVSIPENTGSLNKTQIIAPTEPAQKLQVVNRKLVGWLVSFTMDPNGKDFRLYEGRNTIGSDPSNDIVVTGDPAVSSKHLTILYRMGKFKCKDEFSTNGTYVNEVFFEEGDLTDGAIIRIGQTVFTFRQI
jgi:pSer/pThr/pTyr-binding forkhead associated (FHA) protein